MPMGTVLTHTAREFCSLELSYSISLFMWILRMSYMKLTIATVSGGIP